MKVCFNDMNHSGNNTLDLISAIEHCQKTGADTLLFEKGTYCFDSDLAPDLPLCVSNHGDIGYRKSAFLLNGIRDLTVDGNGSRMIFRGVMNAFGVFHCKNVTIKNLSIEFPDYPYPNGFVSNVGDRYFDLRFDSDAVFLKNNSLYVTCENFADRVHCDVRFDGHTHEIVHGTGDHSLGVSLNALKKEVLNRREIRFFDPPTMPKITDVFGLLTGVRRASGILLDRSEDTVIENVTVHSCIGIGIMAQCCKNVLLDGIKVTSAEGRYVSAAADATHFVGCIGNVTVKNSLFEHMLDDAINVHGIYTKTVFADRGSAIVRFMNAASVGIELYQKGDRVISVDPETLQTIHTFTVKDATLINRNHIRLTFEETTPVRIGDLIDNVSAYPALLFESNTVRNNRARGMLIATNKPSVIRNCCFHTAGSAVVLECDGKFWFESGAVNDLTIENNMFDNCRYANWGKGIISIPEGKKTVDGFYYHGKIQIKNNRFIGSNDVIVYLDNVKELIYEDNQGEDQRLLMTHVEATRLQETARVEKVLS